MLVNILWVKKCTKWFHPFRTNFSYTTLAQIVTQIGCNDEQNCIVLPVYNEKMYK